MSADWIIIIMIEMITTMSIVVIVSSDGLIVEIVSILLPLIVGILIGFTLRGFLGDVKS